MSTSSDDVTVITEKVMPNPYRVMRTKKQFRWQGRDDKFKNLLLVNDGLAYGYGNLDGEFVPFDLMLPIKSEIGYDTQEEISKVQVQDFNQLSPRDLEYLHALTHVELQNASPDIQPFFCKTHFRLAKEMISRGYDHVGLDRCDRIIELIKGWTEKYTKALHTVPESILSEDLQIVLSWNKAIKSGKKLYKNLDNSKTEITEIDCNRVAEKILKELLDR